MVAVAVVFIFFVSCQKNEEDIVTTGSIQGIVKDLSTAEPLANALVNITPGTENLLTKEDGSFEFNDIEAGRYTVTVQRSGYQPNRKEVVVTAGKKTQCDMVMEKKAE